MIICISIYLSIYLCLLGERLYEQTSFVWGDGMVRAGAGMVRAGAGLSSGGCTANFRTKNL